MNDLPPWLGLVGWFLLVFAAAAVGSWFTAQSVGTWYQVLRKPPWNPPDWVFGPVWTLLYLLMAVAAWLVWRRTGLSGAPQVWGAFFLQLALNVVWSALFFGLRSPLVALLDLILLIAAIVMTILCFLKTSRTGAWLLLPYLAWVLYALTLNVAIVMMNWKHR